MSTGTELNENRDAVTHTDGVLNSPTTADAWFERGRWLVGNGSKAEAEQCFEKAVELDENHHDSLYMLGLLAHRRANREAAKYFYERCLEVKPNYFEALNDYGVLAQELGNAEQALKFLNMALEVKPEDPGALLNLGLAFSKLEKYEEAALSYERAIRARPEFAAAHQNRGNLYRYTGQVPQSIEHFKKAIQYAPHYIDAYVSLGLSYFSIGDLQQSIETYTKALEIEPNHISCLNNLGLAYMKVGKGVESIGLYKKAIEIESKFFQAYNNLGLALNEAGRFSESIEYLEKAIELKPDFSEAVTNLSFAYRESGQVDKAIQSHKHLLNLESAAMDDGAFVKEVGEHLLALHGLPIIYETQEEILECRERFKDNVEKALKLVLAKSPISAPERTILRRILFTISNFYLAYQQRDDRELQEKYARLSLEILKSELQQFLPALTISAPVVTGKIRIGLATEFLKAHNGAFYAYDWLSRLPRDEYEIFLYSLNGTTDEFTKEFEKLGSYKWLPFDENSYINSMKVIQNDSLHVLLIPDIGMGIPTKILSLVRLATIQCTGWGHPVTSGSSNIDYYLSSDLMEPEGAEKHYSEELVRLPNLGLYLRESYLLPKVDTNLSLDLPADRIVYGCVQSLFKYLPQHDWIYPAIAKQVPEALFLFVGNKSEELTTKFAKRLERAFEKEGLSFDKFVMLIPRMNLLEFNRLLEKIDVNLDSIGWSGGVTTARSLLKHLPMVTMSGAFMRGRHSLAMLRRINLDELVANTEKEYVDLAVRLGSDSEYRKTVSESMNANRSKLLEDDQCVEGLHQFMQKTLREVPDSDSYSTGLRKWWVRSKTGSIGRSAPFYIRRDTSDYPVLLQVFNGQDYALAHLRLYSDLRRLEALNQEKGLCPLVLDMGANTGAASVFFCQNHEGARVIALEPEPENFKLLCRNTEKIDCVAINGAIASTKGRAKLFNPGGEHFEFRTTIDEEGQIECFTINELLTDHLKDNFYPFIAKIDIEGAEADLFSANTEWVDLFPVIIVELHDWMLPGENTSANFLKCIAGRSRDFIHIHENIFSVRTPVLPAL